MTSQELGASHADLEERLEEFSYRVSWSGALLDALKRENLRVTHIHPTAKGYLWFMRVLLPAEIQDAFGTAPEVLLTIVRGRVQARDLERARGELYRANYRLDLDLVVVCDEHPQLAERLARLPGRWGQWVPWPAASNDMGSLLAQFQQHLTTYDLFEETNPVRGRGVIGREKEVTDLSSRIENGESVGIFGLRKVGKTSVVRAVTDALDGVSAQLSMRRTMTKSDLTSAEVRMLVFWLDVQSVFDRTSDRLFSHLAASIERRLALHGIETSNANGDVLQRVNDLLRLALDRTELTLCLVLDEYDFLFEGSEGQAPIRFVPEFLRMLRGMAQETGRLSIVVIGRDPRPFESPELDGFPNPMLGWFVPRWIGPLMRDSATELLIRIGRRVGLEVGTSTCETAMLLTGGHPLLHRQLGSALLSRAQRQHEPVNNNGRIETDSFYKGAALDFHERGPVREICREVLYLLRQRFPRAYDHLVYSSRTSAKDALRTSTWNSPPVTQLRNFGLILGDSPIEAYIPGVLSVYIRTFERKRSLDDHARYTRPRPRRRHRGWHQGN